MALLTLSEAALRSGFSVELLEVLLRRCPKSGETRTLPHADVNDVVMINERELDDYCVYLRAEWPTSPQAKRPRIPDYIAEDVRAECHYSCAICGSMDNGEVAHIDAVASSKNNSPDNLILLCPNHHTEYDFGFRPSSNVTPEAVRAAKAMKRESRRRMLRHEGNVARALRTLLTVLSKVEARAAETDDPATREAFVTELRSLVGELPDLIEEAGELAARDQTFSDAEAAILRIAPTLGREAVLPSANEFETRSAVQNMVGIAAAVIDLGEVECPRCGGRGTQGLVGDLCSYCGGSCFVTPEEADEYDPADLDEVECPRCGGRGTQGLVGDTCSYCGGSCFVTPERADEYDPADLDEVGCPRCGGRGTQGLVGDTCSLCKGGSYVTPETAAAYRERYG